MAKTHDNDISIREVKGWFDLYKFIHLPLKLHKGHKAWTPPLLMDEWNVFNPHKNHAFDHCTATRLLAYRNGEVVGRVLGIIRKDYNLEHNENNARFAFLETPDDIEVAKSLLQKVEQWAIEQGCDGLVGPFGFSDKDPQGMVIEGFDEPAMMFTNGNFSYMPQLIEKCGFSEYIRLVQYKLPVNNDILDNTVPYSQRVLRNGTLKVVEFTRTKDIKPYINEVFELINQTYTDIYGFTKVTRQEANDFANRFLPLLNPQLIKIVLDQDGKIAAFVVAIANLGGALKKSDGRLFPTGWYHLLKASKRSRELVLLLGAIRKDMQNKGINAVLGEYLIRSAMKLNYEIIDSHLIMESNHKMRAEIERLKGSDLYKKYCIYQKNLVKLAINTSILCISNILLASAS